MKLSNVWKNEDGKKINEPFGAVRSLKEIEIKITPPGLLSKDNIETASVSIKYDVTIFEPDINNSDENYKKNELVTHDINGVSGQVYTACLDSLLNNNRDLFISTWNVQKDRKYKSMTGIPFRTAQSSEKLYTKVTEAGMTPQKFAKKVNKDYGNFFRELKGQTKLTLKQAVEYAKELNCDPVELLFEDLRCEHWGNVDLYRGSELNEHYMPGQIIPQKIESIVVPRNIYTPNIKAIKIYSPGSYLDNHFAYYKKSDTESSSHNGRLVVAGRDDPELEEHGIETESFWFGIYDIQKGGGQSILNVDPFAKNKEVVNGPFAWVAPVITTVAPGSLKRNYDYYEMNRKAGEYFRFQEMDRARKEEYNKKLSALVNKGTELTKKAEKDLKKLVLDKVSNHISERFYPGRERIWNKEETLDKVKKKSVLMNTEKEEKLLQFYENEIDKLSDEVKKLA